MGDPKMNHEIHMQQALNIAKRALDKDEFPVGCVIVADGEIIAHGERTNTHKTIPSELDHAEIHALRKLEQLEDASDRGSMALYATLEPCLMCFGAILISGIGTIVYAYEDAMGGGTSCDRSRLPSLYSNQELTVVPGICRKESLALFQAFYRRPHINYWKDSYLARYTLTQT